MARPSHNNKRDGYNLQRMPQSIPEYEDFDYFSRRALIVSRDLEQELEKEVPSEDKRKNRDTNAYKNKDTDKSHIYIRTFV